MKAVYSGGSKKKKIVSYSKFLDFTQLKDHPNSFIEIKML